jgi:uncharacterized repeat protein (TIGR01451 family)
MRITLPSLLMTLIAGLAASGIAFAEGEVELKTTAQQEVRVVDASGREVTKLVTASKVVPGDEVIYTITARNLSDQAVESVVIDDPIPEHMTYVMGSAVGEGTVITFSIDGGESFDRSENLVLTDASGTSRAAEARDYTTIRWILNTALAPAATRSVSFRAKLD